MHQVIDRRTTTTDDSQRYDLVFDAVGKCSFRQCRNLLKQRGIWASTDLGPLSQNPLLAVATRFSRGRRVIFPLPRIDRDMVQYLKGLVEAGQFTPVIDRTYPLEEIVEAYRYVETQQKIGNVIITIAGDGQDCSPARSSAMRATSCRGSAAVRAHGFIGRQPPRFHKG